MSQDFSKTFATLAYSLRPQIDQELAKEMESYVVKVGAILQSWEAIAEFNGSLQGKRRGEQYVCRSVGCLMPLFKKKRAVFHRVQFDLSEEERLYEREDHEEDAGHCFCWIENSANSQVNFG